MRQIKRFLTLMFLMFLINPLHVLGQDVDANGISNEKLILAAREIMTAAGTCALITLDKDYLPMVRTMDPFPPEKDLTVWFGTKAESRKVQQIKNNSNVTLYYLDSDASGYVVIHGTAQLIDDPEEKQKRWKDTWEAFYPNNREGYVLIKVSPDWMEILSVSRGITGDPMTWQTPVVRFD